MNINSIQNPYVFAGQQSNIISTIKHGNIEHPNVEPGYKTKPSETDNKQSANKVQNSEGQNFSDVKKEASSQFANEQENELTRAEKMLVSELKQIDQAVKRHEMAHVVAGGRYILSGANYSYRTGPDGKRYVVGGEVSIDTAPVPGDPQETINKMRQVHRAALAPVDPSPQDRRVASTAMAISTKAMAELMVNRVKEKADSDEEKAFGNIRKNADQTYTKIQNIQDNQQESTFAISA